MHFTNQQQYKDYPSINVRGDPVENGTQFKYLGLVFDTALSLKNTCQTNETHFDSQSCEL